MFLGKENDFDIAGILLIRLIMSNFGEENDTFELMLPTNLDEFITQEVEIRKSQAISQGLDIQKAIETGDVNSDNTEKKNDMIILAQQFIATENAKKELEAGNNKPALTILNQTIKELSDLCNESNNSGELVKTRQYLEELNALKRIQKSMTQ